MIAADAATNAATAAAVKVVVTEIGTVDANSVEFAPDVVDAAFSNGGNGGSIALLNLLGSLVAMPTNCCTNWIFFVLFFIPCMFHCK